MRKRKPYTKAQVKRLIREIAKVTQGEDDNSNYFASLLSAMRGPDSSNVELKSKTTEVIRTRLGWRCGLMFRNRPLAEVVETVSQAESDHFLVHIESAVMALEYFGYGDKQTKGGEKA